MDHAYRSRKTDVDLKPGESRTWRLPPITAGVIGIDSLSTRIGPPGASTRSAGPGGAVGIPVRFVNVLPIIGIPGGTIARARPRFPIGHPATDLEIDPPGGGSGPTIELTLELMRGGQVVQQHQNHIFLETPDVGDVWSLRVTRVQDGSLDLRTYRILVLYPSVLPIERLRIPAKFFERAVQQNWIDNPYIQEIRLTEHMLAFKWEEKFADMYGQPKGDQYIELPKILKFPEIKTTSTSFSVSVGGAPNPIPDPSGTPHPDVPYLQLDIEGTYYGSHDLELDIPGVPNPSITLPDKITARVRMYLVTEGSGSLAAIFKVTSPLLDLLDRNVSYPTLSGHLETVNLKAKATELIEAQLYGFQHPGDNSKVVNILDHFARPYLTGHSELVNLIWDEAAKEIVILYVGKQKVPVAHVGTGRRFDVAAAVADWGMMLVDPNAPPESPPPENPRMFDTPDEMPPTPKPPAPTENRSAGALAKIDHIVVLMQENRSFDQVLGYLSRDGILPREHLLTGNESAGREVQPEVDGLLPGDNTRNDARDVNEYGGKRYPSTRTRTTAWPGYDVDNPWHGSDAVRNQVSDNMKGFVRDFASHGHPPEDLHLIMEYFTDAELPAYGALTREFAICDRWYCSHLGGTLPNRFISLTGDFNRDAFGNPEVNNPHLSSFYPIEAETFFDHLTSNGVSWRLFEHGYGTMRLFRNYTFDETNISGFNDEDNGFAALAKRGLPSVTFIEPDYIEAPGGKNNDDHAPADMIDGQRLVASIMSALLDSPSWEKTLFIITYDEHGGFYDHAQPATESTTTAADGTVTRTPIPTLSTGELRLGLRVPAFVISPFIESMPGGKVNVRHTVFDHTTIPATILRRFCEGKVPIMGARTSAIADVGEMLTRDTPRPRAEFEQLAREMKQVAARPAGTVQGKVPRSPMRRPQLARVEDEFTNLIAFASAVTGGGKR